MARPLSPDVERVPVICNLCDEVFLKPVKRNSAKRCPTCTKLFASMKSSSSESPPRGIPKNHIETVLPQKAKARFDKTKMDWFMPVRTRKRKTREPLMHDKVFLHVGAAATPDEVDAAYTAAYARLSMQGAANKSAEKRERERKKKQRQKQDRRDWKTQGEDRNFGISKLRVQRTVYAVHIPDPKNDGKRLSFGTRYESIQEARAVRVREYNKIKWDFLPCQVCGELPMVVNHRIIHLSPTCKNRVQFPVGLRPLFQTKLWNFQFSTGKFRHVGRISRAELYQMGFLSMNKTTGDYHAIAGVELDTKRHVEYAALREQPRDSDEVFFE